MNDLAHINWYPGHMKKTRELIAENLKLVDFVIEVIDARIPRASRNPIIAELTAGKQRIVCLNKRDLADEEETLRWASLIAKEDGVYAAVPTDGNAGGKSIDKLLSLMAKIPAKRSPARALIAGVPNSGKSSLINRLTGRRSAGVGDRPGFTKGKQWLTLSDGVQLLDTPGILWPKFEDPDVGLDLAFCGSIKDEISDPAELGLALIERLREPYHEELAARYGESIFASETLTYDLGETSPALHILESIALLRGLILPGKRIDYERAGRAVIADFRSGKLGRITLETP